MMTQMMIGGTSPTLALSLVIIPHVGDFLGVVWRIMTDKWFVNERTFL